MARRERQFVCQDCGAVYRKWQGRCDACEAWNTIVEEAPVERRPGGPEILGGRALSFASLDGGEAPVPRVPTGLAELDRVLGGGIVHGSAILIGGDPGIGKSTLLLQVMAALAAAGHPSTYISGEEAIAQIRLRAQRLGLTGAPLRLAASNSLRDILTSLNAESRERAVAAGGIPEIVVVDSIQTVYADGIDSAAGTVSQVRACAHELVRHAKASGAAVLLVGHVTKEGQLAGPRVVEHMVDTVLYFEGDRGHQFRILRAVKNRFGATDEIAVFEMGDAGLAEVANPSALFLADREAPVSGACVFAGIEGTRPLLMELQALVAESPLGTPRRAVVGWDGARLAMVLAVLETRCGVRFGASDIYLNVAGGLRVREPAADLAAAAALLSALTDKPLPQKMVAFGEVSLAGEIRPVTQMEARLKEAAKLGFTEALVPAGAADSRTGGAGMRLREARHLHDIVPMIAAEAA
ncbi:DNA repair protein RadA [Marinibaculum pumilum]|uniref:DNA repair protein RadA n=1 Tax=Marinibaculum pumilum TaxID=1766165 RepID=A0ABV7KTR1_9PROT